MNTTQQTPTLDSNPETAMVSLLKMTNDSMMKLKSHSQENSI